MANWTLLFIVDLLLKFYAVFGVELTFELYDNAKDCFYEVIEKDTPVTLEYQVVTGGQYDVDVSIESPNGELLFQQYKSQYDTHSFTAQASGPYAVCFGNEFSTFSHKVVYMDFQVGEEKPLHGVGEHITVMTQLETSTVQIYGKLNTVYDYQTHHRLREATSRKRAEDLNTTVFRWCFAETCVIFVTMISQVLIVKNFFNDSRTTRPSRFLNRPL